MRGMILRTTNTKFAPYYILRSDNKKVARLNYMLSLLNFVPYKKLPWQLETMIIRPFLQIPHRRDAPLMRVGKMWPGLIEGARNSMLAFDPPLANPEDMTIPR